MIFRDCFGITILSNLGRNWLKIKRLVKYDVMTATIASYLKFVPT